MSYFTLPHLRPDDDMTASRPYGKSVSGTSDDAEGLLKTTFYQY